MKIINNNEINAISGGFAGSLAGAIEGAISGFTVGAVFGGKYTTAGNGSISLGWTSGISELFGIIAMPWAPALFGFFGGFFVPIEDVRYVASQWIPIVINGENRQ